METIHILHVLKNIRELSTVPGFDFKLIYYPYSRTRQEASAQMEVKEHCTWRLQLPNERFSIHSDNLFLFTDGNGEPKMCYTALLRYIAFSFDNYKLRKIRIL